MSSDLTILLTTNGREQFTRRWLRWMARCNCRHKILIADGGGDSALAAELASDATFASLDVEYVEYPLDADVGCYMNKLANVASRISTPFVVLADNDDFLLMGSLEVHLDLLRSSPGFASVGSHHYRFAIRTSHANLEHHLYPGAAPLEFTRLRAVTDPRVLHPDPMVRLNAIVEKFYTAEYYYALHRTSDFLRIAQALAAAGISRVTVYECILVYGFAASGKAMLSAGAPFVVRQEATSSSAATAYDEERWDNIFLLPDWSDQLCKLTAAAYAEVLHSGGKVGRQEFDQQFRRWFREFLLGWLQFRGVANAMARYPRAYALGRQLFRLYRGKKHPAVSQRAIARSPELAALDQFLRGARR